MHFLSISTLKKSKNLKKNFSLRLENVHKNSKSKKVGSGSLKFKSIVTYTVRKKVTNFTRRIKRMQIISNGILITKKQS